MKERLIVYCWIESCQVMMSSIQNGDVFGKKAEAYKKKPEKAKKNNK